MDIKVLDSWLREYLETKAKPEEISQRLSASSQSVEKLIPVGKKDFLYEIEVTTNRPDAFSIHGIARELSAVLPQYGLRARLLPIPEAESKIPEVKEPLPLKVEIAASELVPRFTALIFDQVEIKPSPVFVRYRLEQSGIRSLNNVIDISNYLMLELGQPMHTFDYDKILGAEMIVRQAKKGEKITTLDGQVRPLSPGAIIIEDGEGRIIDLCGIMGGQNSEVDEKTKRVLLFIQTYDPLSIRRACQALAFRTEAASRFEKGIDPEGVIIAMRRAIKLFADWTGGKVASQLYDVYPNPPKPYSVTLKAKRLNRLLGVEIELGRAKEILEALGFETTINEKKQELTAKVPHWRYGDVAIPEDLIEEIARIYGYQNFPDQLPPISTPQKTPRTLSLEDQLKSLLAGWGYTESPTYSMTSAETQKKAGFDPDKLLAIANPLSIEWVYLRTSLLPSLLEVIAKNLSVPQVNIFEASKVYLPQGNKKLPDERPKLAALIAPGHYLEAKGALEAIFEILGVEARYQETEGEEILENKIKTAEVLVGKEVVGRVGEINPKALDNFEIKRPVAFFELDLASLEGKIPAVKTYQPIAKFPPIIEDFSFVLPQKTTVAEVEEIIRGVSSLIKEVQLIDIYDQTRTFRITYQSNTRGLSDKDIEPIRKMIIEELKNKSIFLKE